MPLAKHRPDFAELIATAAVQRKRVSRRQRLHYSQIRQGYKADAKVSALKEEEEGGQGATGLVHENPPAQQALTKITTQDVAVSISVNIRWFLDLLVVRILRFAVSLLAFLNLVYESSNGLGEELDSAAELSDIVVAIYFLIEGILKVSAFYAQIDMQKSFNLKIDTVLLLRKSGILDIILGVLSLYFGASRSGGWIRLIRHFYISSFILEEIPHLVILVSGITHGLKSILSTCLLLSLVFIVYAACALFFFEKNDPYHFGTIALAMWSFFELATLDNWSQVLYVNMYGCDGFPAYYTVVNSSYTGLLSISRYGSTLYLPVCTTPEPYPVLAVFMFLSFIIICGFILVNLTIAAVTSGINRKLDKIKDEGSSMSVMGALVKAESMACDDDEEEGQLISDPDMLLIMLRQVWKEQDEYSKKKKLNHAPSLSKKMKSFDDSSLNLHSHSKTQQLSHSSLAHSNSLDDDDFEEENVNHWEWRRQSMLARDILAHGFHHYGVIGIIIFSALMELIALQTQSTHIAMLIVNLFIQILFTIELYIQVIAMYPKSNLFFESKWNTFDAAIVVLTWIPVCAWGRGSGVLGLLNVLRILRLLRLLRWIHELNVILHSIASSALAIFYVYVLIIFMSFHFAVAGVFLFDKNDPQHFGTVASAFVTLFQIMSLDDWSEIARTNMYGCDFWGYDTGEDYYDEQCVSPLGRGWFAAFYFLLYVTLSVMVLLSLFVGIIITSMELLKEGIKEENEVWEKVKVQQRKYNMRDATINNLLEIFDLIDVGKNGKLTLNELKPIFDIIKISESSQFSLFMMVDTDDSGQIDFSEFLELIYLVGKAYKVQCKKTKLKMISKISRISSGGIGKQSTKTVDSDEESHREKNADGKNVHGKNTAKVYPKQLSAVIDDEDADETAKKQQNDNKPNRIDSDLESIEKIKALKEVTSEFNMSFFLKQVRASHGDNGNESKDSSLHYINSDVSLIGSKKESGLHKKDGTDRQDSLTIEGAHLVEESGEEDEESKRTT